MFDSELSEYVLLVLFCLVAFFSLMLHFNLIVKKIVFNRNRREKPTCRDYDLAVGFPICALRHYITQLVNIELIPTNQKVLKEVIRSAIEGSAYWVNHPERDNAANASSSTENTDIESKSSKLVLSPVDQPDIRISTEYGPLIKVKDEDIHLLLENEISISHVPESKLLSYLKKLGFWCALLYWVYVIHEIFQSWLSLGYVTDGQILTNLTNPFFLIPLLHNTSVYKPMLFITVETGDFPPSMAFAKLDARDEKSNTCDASNTPEIPGSSKSMQREALIRYSIQRILGSILYMILYYPLYFGLAALTTSRADTAFSQVELTYLIFIRYCLLAEPIVPCIRSLVTLGQVTFYHPNVLRLLSWCEFILMHVHAILLPISSILWIFLI
ncbi:hypothetical protein K493DRAFT_387588 [Basidiobolus meristosporus CBS 931.73]|uniref:Uncharacterized protein n=1 Tax=Basidiobolus meristosporus CBS 931.73 TaxID=1314790 RepID=A0A1Y1XE65_9FUNG|nr:hypothetical protein K493DRAFT_387588 [Basidiobolus meristosporus CBS 931.73]|eukprot:ORX84050.1 hypothetical protein K493DRAFT_387588 [Basidiobolus meristosporus CBS 931.73]